MQDFFLALANNFIGYVLALLISGVILGLFIRSSIACIYDPFTFQFVQTVFASATVLFMYKSDVIPISLMFYHFFATVCFLTFSGVVFSKMIGQSYARWHVRISPLSSFRNILLLIFIISQVLAWALVGIPVLLESRLNAFSSGEGIGIASRLISFTSFATIFLTVLRFGVSKKRQLNFMDIISLIFVVISSVANGSKSNIVMTLITVLMANWLFQKLISNYKPLHFSYKNFFFYIILTGILVLVPVVIEIGSGSALGNNTTNPFEALFLRMIMSGDSYMWFYGDDYLSLINQINPTTLLFADFLGLTRIVSWNELPIHPGLQVFQALFPNSTEIRGPNLRFDVFGLLYGNFLGGAFISILLGCFFGLIRGWIFQTYSPVLFLPVAYLFFQAPALMVDPTLGVVAMVNGLLSILVVAFASFITGNKSPFLLIKNKVVLRKD